MGDYEDARSEARAVLARIAKARSTIPYSDLVKEIDSLHLEPDSKVLAQMLDEISSEADSAGRGMLSAVVVHKTDDYLPGTGFFALAKHLGRDPSDRVACHAQELARVHEAFA